jgi:hypothetical protein
MPAKYDRCVKKVKRQMKRTGYKGNPYAICSKLRAKGKPKKLKFDKKFIEALDFFFVNKQKKK